MEFTDCADLTVIFSGGTDYAPDFARQGYRDPSIDPQPLSRSKVAAAAGRDSVVLRNTHVADYRGLFGTMAVSLGTSTKAQQQAEQVDSASGPLPGRCRTLTLSWRRPTCRYGRYLMICGSRDGLPMGLQGAWIRHQRARLDGRLPH